VGPSVEIRREKRFGGGSGGGGGSEVPSPAPMVVGGVVRGVGFDDEIEEEGEPIVISVGLLPSPSNSNSNSKRGSTRIYPLQTFTLDIFVFNQSTWTRRFEISYPDRRRRRKQDALGGSGGAAGRSKELLRGLVGDGDRPGILPLENRVRIG
jgi:hypothetical protein